jgi:hypothetical protein
LLWTVVLVAAAVGANVVGIYLVGSVASWELLADGHGGLLPCVAAVPVRRNRLWGWLWMRRRLPGA